MVRLLGTTTVETNESKHPALVMELMQGGSLHDFLHCRTALSPPLTPQAQHRIALDVALGLQYLHSLGWMHRDVRQPVANSEPSHSLASC